MLEIHKGRRIGLRLNEKCFSFYRSFAGAEIDLILKLPDQRLWAIEVKRTTNPKVTRGFHIASDELDVTERLLVYAGEREVPRQGGLRTMPLAAAIERLHAL